MIDEKEELQSLHKGNYSTDTKWFVSKIAYLIGVKKNYFGENANYDLNVFNELDADDDYKTVRMLCLIRNTVMRNVRLVSNSLKYELKNLDRIDWFEKTWFEWLDAHGIHVLNPAFTRSEQYLLLLNNLIETHIGRCKKLVPSWIKWDYIVNLFEMPCKGKESIAQNIANTFWKNPNSYPFQAYINWPIFQPSAYSMKALTAMFGSESKQAQEGNVMSCDQKFAVLLYRVNHDEFYDAWRFRDASDDTKNSISAFIDGHNKIDIVVDCENSDPFKLVSFVRCMQEVCSKKGNSITHINKILLFDDVHTSSVWKILKNCIDVPICYVNVERLKENKSLVDGKLIAETCKEYYIEHVDGFLLASSDSDFYVLINSLQGADFFVCLESAKRSTVLTKALDEIDTPYCYMDDFNDCTDDVRQMASVEALCEYVAEHVQLNRGNILEFVSMTTSIPLMDLQRTGFVEKYLQRMLFEPDESGEYALKLDY